MNAAPFVRKPILEEFEARLLLSADLNPLASDAVLAPPATVPAEFRSLGDIGLPPVVTSVQVAPLQRTHEIVFVDTSTPDYAELVAAMRESAPAEGRKLEFVLIDAERDGIRKITDTLAQKRDLDAIHIISHATDGAVRLGAATLDFDTLVKRAGAVKKWGDALTEQGDILLYGCDLAATQEGKSLMDAIARLTGADVAASENPTGAAALGGDWDLEFSIGSIESALAVPLAMQQSYGHVLAPGISVHAQAGAVFAFESGADARIEVVLTEAPTANVTIPVSSSNAAQMTVSAASLVFTPLNWNVAQTLVASAVNDAIAEGDLACTVVLGAAVSGDAAYNGLDPADVVVTVIDDDNTRIGGSNLIAYYLFDEPSGTAVLDKSNNGPALDLTMNTAEGSGWNRATAGAIQVTGNDVIAQSAAGPHKVYSRIVTAQQFTVEAWVQSSTLSQPDTGPHRLVTLSADTGTRNFTLGVNDSDETPVNAYGARVRTNAGDGNGVASEFFTGANTAGLGLSHVVLTVDSSGNRRLYVNGTLSGSVNAPVTYASWDSAFRLALFNELTLDRDWLGTMHLAAIYDRALTATEVQRNYTAGANENTLIVDTDLDVIDGDVSSIGALLQNKGGGTISLREAITAANNTALVGGQAHRIFFNLPGAASSASPHVITLSSALPNITRAMLIDGWSEPDFTGTPVIVLDGNASVGNGFTLTATADGSTIRGFVIRDFNDDAVVDNGIDGYGVYIQAGSDGNTIAGNYIGRLEADGTAVLVGNHNRGDGIRVDGANNVIGGNSTVDRNIIAGNAGGADNDEGILVWGNNNQIVGNWIGIDGTGAALANGDDGIDVKAGSGTLIRNNVIAGNTNDGIVITGGAGSVTMQGNRIGVNAAGTIVANGQSGILVEFGATNNVIGGIAAGEGNVIAGNGANGVRVTEAASRASILQNAIYANTGLGINLVGGTQNGFGVTANDGPGDADTGPNALQNYPVLSSVVTDGTNVTIAGTINVNNGGSFRIEFFANAVPAPGGDPSGHGEGGRYIGALQITDNGAGDTNAATGVIAFSTTFAAAGGLAAGELVTATATRTDASFTSFFETSEFSQNVAATSLNSPPAAADDSYSVNEDSLLTATGGSWDAAMGAWAYRAQLTIGNIAAGSLTDFPLLVQIDTTRFGASFYSQAKAGGADLRFVDPDGTLLAYEIESWNPGGTSYAWVRVPTLTTTGGDFIRMYWGNAAALDAQNADAVWMTSYVGVWHLNGSANDSSGTGNHGTFSGTTATTGVIAGGRDYNGSSDYISVPNVASLRLTTAMTLEAWIRADSFGAGNDVDALIRMGTDNPNDYQLALLDGRPYFQLEGSDDGSGLTGSLLNTGNWYHVVATLDGSTWSIYVNGTLDASRVQAVTITPDTTRPIFIGGRSGGTDVPDGRLDEVRISNVARSADWIRAQYASMADTLLGYGTPELRPTGVLANDSDPDLDPLTAVLVAGPSHAASFTLNADGSFSYTPLANFNGTDSFTYRANDGSAFSNIATVTITVNAVNDAPTRTAASATLPSVNEDTANPPGATVAALFGPVFSDAADQVTGGSSANALAGIAIEANAANAGTEGRWQYSTNGGTSWINLPAVSTASAFALDTSALLRFLPNANYNGTPGSLTTRLIDDSAGAVVSATFVDVTVSGGTTRYANAANAVTLATSVNAVNDAPHGADNTVNVLEDGSYVFAAGDFGFGDPSDTPANAFLAVRIASLPATGALTNNGVALNVGDFVSEADIALGRLVFTPAANANGTGYASFTFQVQDDGGTASGGIDLDPTPNTLVIDVTPVNDAPAGADNTVSMAEDGTYVFAAPDFGFSDPSDSPANGLAAVRIATLPAQGTLFLLGFGNVVAGQSIGLADLTAGNLRYSPAPDANGLAYASFTFQVRDDGGTANGGTDLDPTPNTLVIDVAPVNDAPVASPDAAAVQEDLTLVASGNVLANDTDVDAGDTMTVSEVNGAAANVGAAVAGTYGAVTINADGSYTYTLNNASPLVQALAAGQTVTDAFTYLMRDSAGATSTATLTVTVSGTNDAPVASPDAAAVQEDLTLVASGNVLANDTDVDAGDTMTVSEVNGAAANVGAAVAGTYGAVTINADGSYTYTLNNASPLVQALAAGQTVTDAFTYLMRDSAGATSTATLTVTVSGTNDAPVGVADTYTGNRDTPLIVAASGVLANDADVDAGDSLTVLSTGTFATTAGGSVTINADGSFVFTPLAGFTGNDTFGYTVRDAAGATGAATVTVTVTANRPPIANDDPAGYYDTVATDASLLSYWRLGEAAGATVASDEGGLVNGAYPAGANKPTLGVGGAIAGDSDTAASFDGNDYVVVAHNAAFASANGTVQLWFNTANPAQRGALLSKDSLGFDTGGHLTIWVDNGRIEVRLQNTSSDYFVRSPVNSVTAGTWHHVAFSFGGDGMRLYLNGLLVASNGYTGGTLGNAEPLVIGAGTVFSGDGTPFPLNDYYTGRIDEVAWFGAQLGAADIQKLYLLGSAAQSYATDQNTVLAIPAASGVLANDLDPDADPLAVVAVNGAGPVGAPVALPSGARVTLNANGSFAYDPNGAFAFLAAGANAVDTFTYTVGDGQGGTASATVTVRIAGLNDAPVASPDAAAVQEDLTLLASGNVLANDTDVDAGDTMTVSEVNGAAANVGAAVAGTYGAVTINADGSYTYTLNNASPLVQALAAGQTVTDAFTYLMRDSAGATSTATLTVTVSGTNDAPVASPDAAAVQEDLTLVASGNVLANDTDVDAGDTMTVSEVNGAAANVGAAVAGTYGAVTINADGSYTYTLNNASPLVQALAAGQTVTDAFTYLMRDSAGATSTATLTVTVSGTNDAPVASPDAAAVQEDLTLLASGNVLANDTDVDAGDTMTVSEVNGAAANVGAAVAGTYGAVTINADGSYTYTLNNASPLVQALAAGQTVTDAFTYLMRDSAGATSTATLTVTVSGTNDAPLNIAPAVVSGFEDTPFAIGGLSVVDPDVEPLQVRLSAAAGTLSLAPGGATVIAGASGTGTITLSGTVAQLNAALATLVYTGAPDWFGVDILTMISTDPSNASATGTVTINVAPVNDAPVPGNNSFNIRYGAALVLGTPSLSATDIDDAAGSLVFQVSNVVNGRFELVAAPGIAITSFTQAQVMAGQVQFVHNGGGIPSFSLTVTDGALPVGPYAANIVFTGGGDFPAPPSPGGGALFGTPAADSAPTPLTFAPIATAGLTSASVTNFLRAPSSAAASISDGDPRFAEADAPAPAGASRAAPGLVTQEPTVVTDQQLSTVRAQSDVLETAAQRAEIEVAPLEGELRIVPTRAGLDLDEDERQRIEIVLNSIRISGIALSVGAVWWAARAAGLVASLLASTPAWRHVDPLPVLGRDRDEEEDSEWNDPDGSPEAKAKRDEEHRAAWVLEGDSRL